MNETLKTIAERNSCRDFSGEPLTKDQVDALVKAALAAPSAMNRQPWHIMMCTDKSLVDEMDAAAIAAMEANEDKTMYNRIKERGGKVFYNAPCMMMIAGDGSRWADLDCGILVENVALAAHALGLGNVINGMAHIPLDGDKGADFKKRLKWPDGYNFGIAILIGKANAGKVPHDLDMSKVTYV